MPAVDPVPLLIEPHGVPVCDDGAESKQEADCSARSAERDCGGAADLNTNGRGNNTCEGSAGEDSDEAVEGVRLV